MQFFFPGQEIVTIKVEDLDKIRRAAEKAPLRRARYCLHQSHDDTVQEMVIAFLKDSVVPIHRHHGKSESFHVVQGSLEIIFYDDYGVETRRLQLGEPGSGLPFMYRLNADTWHSVQPLTDLVVIHETISGPYEEGAMDIFDKRTASP